MNEFWSDPARDTKEGEKKDTDAPKDPSKDGANTQRTDRKGARFAKFVVPAAAVVGGVATILAVPKVLVQKL